MKHTKAKNAQGNPGNSQGRTSQLLEQDLKCIDGCILRLDILHVVSIDAAAALVKLGLRRNVFGGATCRPTVRAAAAPAPLAVGRVWNDGRAVSSAASLDSPSNLNLHLHLRARPLSGPK